ncbi:MAG: hypothetical protein J7500_02135 [Sphingomonas sp.]|uniref:hypothetical protein n=1 Tax=Sphingomonas sp. TaxID=28214 RepID=UPI001B2C276E|nr:hypothetical protein [Sphingomonas sp.]MBO9621490.1 hypothetical protein [Sphingomonas sp.]
MSRKTSEARREAFFRALAETGNQTIAAERARVSRSWMSVHRAQDPEFRARMEAALLEAKARLERGRGSVRPPSGWGSLDGEELVVRGGNGRRAQIARARLRQWTPRVEARFLGVLAATCNVHAACAEVGLSPASAYVHARRWQGFRERWDEALAIGYLRVEMGLLAQVTEGSGGGELGPEIDCDRPIERMSADQALHLLQLYQHRVHGVGNRPGRAARVKTLEEVAPSILRKIALIRAMDEAEATLGTELLERDRRELARRRGG